MKKLIAPILLLAGLAFSQQTAARYSGAPGTKPITFPCSLTGSPTAGYVVTATSTPGICDFETVGGSSVSADTVKNSIFLTDGGTANAVTGTTTTSYPGAYAIGQAVIFKANATNSGATTININSLGNKNLTKNGSTALAAGNKVSGTTYLAVYDGTQFQLANFTALAADIPTIAESQVTSLVSDLALKAPLASPALTGNPTVPTQTQADNSTKAASTAYVDTGLATKQASLGFTAENAANKDANSGYAGLDSGGKLKAAELAKQDVMDAPAFCLDAGSTDAFACSLSPAITGYVTGTHYRFKANTVNTGAASINLNSLGAKTIVKLAGGITTALADNDIRAGQWVDVVYDGTNMQMESALGNAASSSGTVTGPVSSTTNNCAKFGDTSGTVIADSGSACGGAPVTRTVVTFSATPTFTRSTQIQIWEITLTGNVTSSTVSGASAADIQTFKICQDGTGSRTFAWPTGYSSAAPVSSTASACMQQTFYWDGSAATATSPGITTDLFESGQESAAPATPPSSGYSCWADSTDHAGKECMANGSANKFKQFLSGQDCNPVTGVCTKVNGVSSAATPATDSVQVVTASNTRSDKVIPDCPTSALGYTQSTHAFGCNSITGGSPGGAVLTKTANFTVTQTECNASNWIIYNGSSITATLMATPSGTCIITIQNINSTVLAVGRNGDTINGVAANPQSLRQYESITCSYDAVTTANWVCSKNPLSGTGTIDFGSINDGTCLASTFTLTGAATGDAVMPRYPSTLETDLLPAMLVSAADTIQVRLCNFSGAAVDPASQSFGAVVIH